MLHEILFLIVAFQAVHPTECFLAPPHQINLLATPTRLSSSTHHEPNPLDSSYIKKEEHDPKHSTFHIERGLDTFDNKVDPAHSIHHHLIDVDHDKLNDLNLRAQNAWKPVNVHEIDIDPVSAFAVVFMLIASLLFATGFSG
jgi:hypothetical protein